MRAIIGSTITALFLAAAAPAAQIIGDPSDFEVFSTGPGGANLGDFGVGDTGGGLPDQGRRGVVRFSLAGLSGLSIQSATLTLFIIESRVDQYPAPGIITSTPPLANPGLGDTLVVHIADPGTPKLAAYNSPSIGNDPGVLIAAGAQPNSKTVSIDIQKALQQAIDSNLGFAVFRIQTGVEKDGDGLNDLWFFAAADAANASQRPRIDYSAVQVSNLAPPVAVPEISTGFMVAAGAGLVLLSRSRRGRNQGS